MNLRFYAAAPEWARSRSPEDCILRISCSVDLPPATSAANEEEILIRNDSLRRL